MTIYHHDIDADGCAGCPMLDRVAYESLCLASPDGSFEGFRAVDDVDVEEGCAPKWCPLRSGDVTVRASSAPGATE